MKRFGPNFKYLPLFVLCAFACGGVGYYWGFQRGQTEALADTTRQMKFLESRFDAGRDPRDNSPTAVQQILGDHPERLSTKLPEDQ